MYYWAGKQVRAGCGPFAHPPLWLDLSPAVSLRAVIVALGSALGRPLSPSLQAAPARALAEELFTLLETANRLVVFDQFENWLDGPGGRPRQEYAGASDWLLLNAASDAFSGRVLLTAQSYPQFCAGLRAGV